MTDLSFGYISPIAENERLERAYDASPNTGRTLAGTANAVTFQKKLRKKEDDMRNRPAERVIRPVSDSEKDTAISRHDEHGHEGKRAAQPKHHIDTAAGEVPEQEAYEPYLGVLVDYTA